MVLICLVTDFLGWQEHKDPETLWRDIWWVCPLQGQRAEGIEITKQVEAEFELKKSNPKDVEADTQPTPTEESELEQVTP